MTQAGGRPRPVAQARVKRILLLGFDASQVHVLRALGHTRPDLDVHIYSRQSEDLDPHRIPEGYYDAIAVAASEPADCLLADLLTVADAVPREQPLVLWAPQLPPALLPVLVQAGYTDILIATDQSLPDLHRSLVGPGKEPTPQAADTADPALLVLDALDRPAYANAQARALDRTALRSLLEHSSDQRWHSLGTSLADLAPVSEEPLDWNIQGRVCHPVSYTHLTLPTIYSV